MYGWKGREKESFETIGYSESWARFVGLSGVVTSIPGSTLVPSRKESHLTTPERQGLYPHKYPSRLGGRGFIKCTYLGSDPNTRQHR